MSGTAVSPEVRLAGDIAAQFHHRPADEATTAIAGHIRQFWDPRMRRALLAEIDAGVEADPLVVAAAALLRGEYNGDHGQRVASGSPGATFCP